MRDDHAQHQLHLYHILYILWVAVWQTALHEHLSLIASCATAPYIQTQDKAHMCSDDLASIVYATLWATSMSVLDSASEHVYLYACIPHLMQLPRLWSEPAM